MKIIIDANNGTDDTSKHAKVIDFSTFGDMTSTKFLFQNGTSHRDSTFTTWNRAKLKKKSLCMPENIFPGTNVYPSLYTHDVEAKQRMLMFNFSRRLISKTTAATLLVNRFC